MLSEHVKRYRNVSAEVLQSYVDTVKKEFVTGTIVAKEANEFIVDFVDELAKMFVENKVQLTRSKTTIEKLEKINVQLEIERDNLKRHTVTGGEQSAGELVNYAHEEEHEMASERSTTDNLVVQTINLNRLVKKPRYFNGIAQRRNLALFSILDLSAQSAQWSTSI